MLVVTLSLLLAAGDAEDVAALVKRAQSMAARADPSWTDEQYNAYSDAVAAWRKEAVVVQARPSLKKKEALALLNARVLVAERYRTILSTVPVPKTMAMLGDQMSAAWKDSVEKWKRALEAEATSLKEEARKRAKLP